MQNKYEVISWEEFEKTPEPGHMHVMARRTEDTGVVVTQFFRIVDPVGPSEEEATKPQPVAEQGKDPVQTELFDEPAPAPENIVLEVQNVRHSVRHFLREDILP